MANRVLVILAAIITIGFLALPYLAPALTSFIDPIHGVPGAALAAGLPSGNYTAQTVGDATVVWDRYGVPHIYAETDEAGAYAMGWVTASMRLFQMDLLRRIGEGNLSALVGDAGYDNDVFVKSLRLDDAINETWTRIQDDPELNKLRDLLISYANGVNAYIDYAVENNLLPIEYRVLGQKPVHWRPQDTIAIEKVISLVLAWNDEDLVLGKLVEKWGPQIIAYMDINSWQGTVVQASCSQAVKWGDVSTKPNAYNYGSLMQGSTTSGVVGVGRSPDPTPILSWINELHGLWSIASTGMASNNWVVSGSVTESGKPIVANDPHLQLSAPPIWILAEINTPSFKSIGALFPGTPLVVIGRNQHLAWAFTNVMGDFTDYYYYKWDGDKYLYKGEWLTAEKATKKILVYDPVKRTYREEEITVLETIHGPVLERDGARYAVRWTGLDPSIELQFFVELNNASSVKEAITAQRWFHVPIQNFIVADDKGNFAYSPVGAYPVRSNLPVLARNVAVAGRIVGDIVNRGFIPFNGSNGEGEWIGYVPKEDLPILYDPPTPYIATANSKPWDGSCGDIVGWHYADRYREERIKQLLDEALEDGVITVDEVKKIQTDIVDLSVKDYLETAILPYSNTNYAMVLRGWLESEGPLMSKDDYKPTIAVAWIYMFHKALWEHLYGESSNIHFLRFHYALSIVKAAAMGDDYARKLLPGSLESLVNESLSKALNLLEKYYGTSDYTKWIYGKIHYYLVAHPAFAALNYNRVPANGGPYTVNVAAPTQVDSDTGMPVTHGPSIRQVVDLATNRYNIVLPGGENGNPFSPHYQDLYIKYWTKGEYLTYTLGAQPSTYEGPMLRFSGGG